MSSHIEQHVISRILLLQFANEENRVGMELKKDGSVWSPHINNEARIKQLVGENEAERRRVETEIFSPMENRLPFILDAIESREIFHDQELVYDTFRFIALHLSRSMAVYELWNRLKGSDSLLSAVANTDKKMLRTRTDFVLGMIDKITNELIVEGGMQIGVAEEPHSFVISDTGPLIVDSVAKRIGVLNGVGYKSADALILTLSPKYIVAVCTEDKKKEVGSSYLFLEPRGVENYNGMQRIQAIYKVYHKHP